MSNLRLSYLQKVGGGGIYVQAHPPILFVYPSHLGPWATFGGLVVGRVKNIFRVLVNLCLLGSKVLISCSISKVLPNAISGAHLGLLVDPCGHENFQGVFHIAHHCMSLWWVLGITLPRVKIYSTHYGRQLWNFCYSILRIICLAATFWWPFCGNE